MKKIQVEVCWEVSKTVTVYANDLDEATEIIEDHMEEIADSGCDNSYIDGTVNVLTEYADEEEVSDIYEKGVE